MEFYNPNVPKSIFSWPKSGPPLGHEISWDIWVMTFLSGPPLGAEKPFINEIAVHFSWLLKRAPPSGTFGLWAPLGAWFLFFGLTRGRMIFTKKRFKYKSQWLMRTHQSKFGCPGYSRTEFARVKLRGPAFGLLTLIYALSRAPKARAKKIWGLNLTQNDKIWSYFRKLGLWTLNCYSVCYFFEILKFLNAQSVCFFSEISKSLIPNPYVIFSPSPKSVIQSVSAPPPLSCTGFPKIQKKKTCWHWAQEGHWALGGRALHGTRALDTTRVV